MFRTYKELRSLPTFLERYEYLRLNGHVGSSTFGFDRYLNQLLYNSREWKDARQEVIVRDNGCDLGIDGRTIYSGLVVHHMNSVTIDDIDERNPSVYDPEFLVCVSNITHQAIHYGDESLLPRNPISRTPGDTCPWR